ncbi:MAG: glycosyltransferase [Alphaproteobacteria bacterium]
MNQSSGKERILIVSEAAPPQINGVVRTNQATKLELTRLGHEVLEINPDLTRFLTIATTEAEVYLEFFAHKRLEKLIDEFKPTRRHISTEGPLGWAARKIFIKTGKDFTTSYHTRWPEFAKDRAPKFLKQKAFDIASKAVLNFHAPSRAVMVSSPSIMKTLKERGFKNLKLWTHGVDTGLFKYYERPVPLYENLPRPLLLYFGRVVAEKNLPAFLNLKTEGSKIVIGDGSELQHFTQQYPDVHFLGAKEGEDLARHCAAADICVFPSKNDTFGLTLLEAAAMGLRIAAYPAPGPVDIFNDPVSKAFVVLDDNLQKAVDQALLLPDKRDVPRAYVLLPRFSWASCTQQFLANLAS